jgi:3-keto-disaccharide hydrolase
MRIAVALLLLTTPLAAQQTARPGVVGRWDLTLIGSDGRRMPSWLEIHVSGNGVLVGQMVGVVGSVRPISRLQFDNDTLRWSLPPQWEGGTNDFQFAAAYAGDSLAGSVTTSSGTQLNWSGHRAPTLEGTRPVTWGVARRMFNGTDLTGWHVVGGENQWQAVSGVLTNTKAGGNLVTDQTYGDFKLHVEFRFPKEGNSGVYLRGRYEAQVEDSVVTKADKEGTGGLGAIYGFLIPNQNAAKGANEWQTYDITLVGRMVTVVLNGKTVICQANIPGPTGGALDSDEGKPGPIMLQGDHGPVEYRNLTIRRAR